jgi:hypothetical protein
MLCESRIQYSDRASIAKYGSKRGLFGNTGIQKMWKIIANLKRKQGTSRESFKSYYESTHVPLASKQLEAYVCDYRRNYVSESLGWFPSNAEPENAALPVPTYDCVTEVSFLDRASLDRFLAHMNRPEIQQIIIEDEKRFLDRPSIVMMICEELER